MLCSVTALAAQGLPAGTALPIMLSTTLNAKNDKPGQQIKGELMQEVPLPSGSVIKKGSRVTGRIVSVQRPSRITVQFSQLEDEHQTIPLNVALRAMAASENVFQAGTPIDAASTDEGATSWVTRQVGGDVVFRGRGYVASNRGKIGRWTGTGVWAKLEPGEDCPETDDNGQEQALWVFSTTACGAYGFDKKLTVAHAGRTPPVGQITLQSSKDILVRGGSGWLLIVNAGTSGAVSPNP